MTEAAPLSERIRQRLRDELYTRRITHTDAARRLRRLTGEHWTYDHVGKILRGEVRLLIDDCALLAQAAGISLVELVRDPGKEFVADLTPSELQLIRWMREIPEEETSAIAKLLSAAAKRAEPPTTNRHTIRERMARSRYER